MRDKLRALIAQLRLHGVAERLATAIERAKREAIPRDEGPRACPERRPGASAAPELLYRLLSQEAASSQERSLAYRLSQSSVGITPHLIAISAPTPPLAIPAASP